MKTLGIIVLCFAFCVGLIACGDMLSPVIELNQVGRDMSTPNDNVHESIGANESCGTASERSGCHDNTIIISKVKARMSLVGYDYEY